MVFGLNIEFNNICKSYGKKVVLDGLNLSANSGECVGILGKNGSGKSTFFSVVTGLQKGEGSFLCDGEDLLTNTAKRNKKVGFVPQSPPLLNELSAKDNLLLCYSKKDLNKELDNGCLKMLGINEFLRLPVSKLSGGMKKRLAIGCAMSNNPDILFLDEPSSALDLICKENIYNYLNNFKNNGGIVILATHDIYEISVCDRVYVLKNGKLNLYDGSKEIKNLVEQLK